MNETQRRRRGHAFLPPKAVLKRIPPIYGTEGTPTADKTVWAHYFSAASDYYITELDQENWEAYGYVKLANFPEGAEWGYIPLDELEQVKVPGRVMGTTVPDLVIVERDMYWEPKPFSKVKP